MAGVETKPTNGVWAGAPAPRSLAILRPRPFERAPERGVTQAEPVPPEIEHLPVTAEHAAARYARGRGDQRRKAVVHPSPTSSAQACEQVPECERVARTGFREHDAKLRILELRAFVAKIKLSKRLAERRGSVIEVGCAGSDAGPGRARRARRD